MYSVYMQVLVEDKRVQYSNSIPVDEYVYLPFHPIFPRRDIIYTYG